MNELSIYIYGDTNIYHQVFNAIAMLINDGVVQILGSVALMIMFIRIGLTFSQANPTSGSAGLIGAVAITSAMLVPSTTAHIIDLRTSIDQTKITNVLNLGSTDGSYAYTKVDNLPFGLVFIASTASGVTAALIDKFDQAFAPVNSTPASAIGIGKQHDLMMSLISTANFDKQDDDLMRNFKNAFKTYTKECVIKGGYLPPEGLDYITNNSGDLMEAISPTALDITSAASSPVSVYTGMSGDTPIMINNCVEIYDHMEDNLETVKEKLFDRFKASHPLIDFTGSGEEIAKALVHSGFTTSGLTVVGTHLASLKVAHLNYGLSGSLVPSLLDSMKYELPSAASIAADISANKSMYQIQLDGMGMMTFANKIAPMVIHYSLIFVYSLFLLVIPVAMGLGWENSKRIISNYLFGIVAIHLGYLTAVVANNLILGYSLEDANNLITSLGNNMTAMTAIPYHIKYVAEMAGISGILLLSSYSIGTAIIFKGDSLAAQGMLNTVGSRWQNGMMTAMDDIARKQSYDQTEQTNKENASKFLRENGFTAPAGVSEVEYANSLMSDLNRMSQGNAYLAAQARSGSDFQSDYFEGGMNKNIQNISSQASFGARTTADSAFGAGTVQGAQAAGTVSALNAMTSRTDDLYNASKLGQLKELSAQATYGDGRVSESAAMKAGINEGSMNSAKINTLSSFDGNKLADGTARQEEQKLQSLSTVGQNMTQAQALASGTVQGIQMVGQAQAQQQALNQHGQDALMNAAKTNTLAQTKDQLANAQNLAEKLGSNLDGKGEYKTSSGIKSMTYDEMAKAESEMKLAGRMGSAGGYRSLGDKAFDMTAENADYGVQSKTLATQKEIDVKGGLNSAVNFNELASGLKAAREVGSVNEQSKLLEDAIKRGSVEGANTIFEAMSKASAVSSAQSMGKELGFAGKLNEENAKSMYNQLLGATDAHGNKMFQSSQLDDMFNRDGSIRTGASLAAWIAEKQSGHLSQIHGLAIEDKMVGIALGNDSVRISSIDSSQNVSTGTNKSALNSTVTGDKAEQHIDNHSIHTGADFRSAVQTFELNGGNKNDTEGLIKFIQNSQLTDAHKKNLLGHIAASVAEQTGLEQHDAESLVAAVGAGVGAVGLNAMLGNPIGKTVDGLKSTTDKLRGIDNETFDNAPNSSNSKNSSNADNGTVNQTNSSNSGKHNDSLSKYTNSTAHNESIAQDMAEVKNANGRNAFNNALGKIGKSLPYVGAAIGAYEVGSGYADGGMSGAFDAGMDMVTMGMYGASQNAMALQQEALRGRSMGGGHQGTLDGFMSGIDRTFGTSFASPTASNELIAPNNLPRINSSLDSQVAAYNSQPGVLGNSTINSIDIGNAEASQRGSTQTEINNEMLSNMEDMNKNIHQLLQREEKKDRY